TLIARSDSSRSAPACVRVRCEASEVAPFRTITTNAWKGCTQQRYVWLLRVEIATPWAIAVNSEMGCARRGSHAGDASRLGVAVAKRRATAFAGSSHHDNAAVRTTAIWPYGIPTMLRHTRAIAAALSVVPALLLSSGVALAAAPSTILVRATQTW